MRASLELQRLIVAALTADAALQARGVTVFDGPPANARPPYLSIGEDIVAQRRWQGGSGTDHQFIVNLWDNREGHAVAKQILADVERAVRGMPADGTGLRLIGLRLVRSRVRRTGKSWTLGQLEFRTLVVMEN